MNSGDYHNNEVVTEQAFSRQAIKFDRLYDHDSIIQYKRKRVRDHIEKYLVSVSQMLELNAGTGEDALYFASKGHYIHATDISGGMLQVMKEKMDASGITNRIVLEKCSYHSLESLQDKGPYDHVYSNFGGMNCTGQLDQVIRSIDPLVKPGGIITMVIISKFCLWEMLLVFKGKFRTAFRRFFSSNGRSAHIEGKYFRCWYYSPSFILKSLPDYDLIGLEGLCTIVPPSYMKGFAEKNPGLFNYLRSKEDHLKMKWPWRNIGDYFIISLKKPAG